MPPFDLELLFTPGLIIFAASVIVAFIVTQSLAFSLSSGLIKAGLFMIYFGVFFDGTFTFLDDWSYLEGGQELIDYNVGITNLIDNWDVALRIGGGEHFVYYLYNSFAIRLFGDGYYAPVALNILLTLLAAYLGTYLAVSEFDFNDGIKKLFFVFLLFHPDILAWSNIMNGKDVLVLMLHVLLLLSCSLFFQSRIFAAIALAIPVTSLLLFLRFYVPLLFACALVTTLLFVGRLKNRAVFIFIGGVLVALAIGWLGSIGLEYALLRVQENFVDPFNGFLRFALTPIPFHMQEEYTFLNLSALIHWLLFPFACWGVIVIRRMKTQFPHFFLLYIMFFVGLYAVYGELQGPRHRVQLDYALAILQFIGLIDFLRTQRWFDLGPIFQTYLAKEHT